MDNEHEIPLDLLVALDACRPDSADAQLPEVSAAIARHPAHLVARAQRVIERADRAVAGALQQGPVPEGLAERILASLAHRPPVAVVAAEPCQAPPSRSGHLPPMAPSRARSWLARPRAVRTKIAIAAAGVVMAAGLLAVALWPAPQVELASVEQFARDFYTADDHAAKLSTSEPPPGFPLDSRLTSARIFGWRHVVGGFLKCPAVAYEMTGRRTATPATLYVFSARSLTVADAGPNPSAPISTGGVTVGVWQSSGHVYVLVVQGGPQDFRSFFPQPQDVA